MQLITMLVDETGVINHKSVPVSFNGEAAKAVINFNPAKKDITIFQVVAYFDDTIVIVGSERIEVYNYETMDVIHYWYVADYDYFVQWFTEYNKEK